jgi:hypothetical protein
MSGAVSTIKKPFSGGGSTPGVTPEPAVSATGAAPVVAEPEAVQPKPRSLFAGAASEVSRGGNQADTLGRPRRRSASRELLG